MKQILYLLIVFTGIINLNAQTWRQYNLATGQITDITFSYTSTASSNIKPGSRGILSDNYSKDTSRLFSPSDIINDPNAYPWRTTVKFNDVTGILIDPYHVLTAGHAIEFHPYFQGVLFMPGYEGGEQPYGYAKAEYFYLLSDFIPGTSKDYAIVKLDRPIGALSGWNGYGYNNSNTFFQNRVFYNSSYPSQSPFNGEYMFNWKGMLNNVSTEYFISSRYGTGGMSGSSIYTTVNNDNIVYGILTNLGIKYNRITANKFDAISKIITLNTPAQFDLIPLYVNASPKQIKSGSSPESIDFVLHNYSNESKTNANITVNVYLSTDQNITTSDELIATYNYQKNFGVKTSEYISQKVSLPVLNKPAGDYYVGIIISGDNNPSNNTTSPQDVKKISITANSNLTIKGKVTSIQSGSGVHFVAMSGFPVPTKTDFNGNYETQVPAGWSGTVTPVKAGYNFSNLSNNYSNVTENTTTNYNATKEILTVSGNVKSPITKTPVKNVKITNLIGEPLTNANGLYTANVFYGWAGVIIPTKTNNLSLSPYSTSINTVTNNSTADFAGGYYIYGRTYDNNGGIIADVNLQGFPISVSTNSYGEYSVFLDSGWTGTVTPSLNNKIFNPVNRNYTNLSATVDGEDYMEKSAVVLNLKVLLSGAMYEESDTMRTTLNYKHYITERPPDTVSGNGTPFVYMSEQYEGVTPKFFSAHSDIVDWVIIELRDSRDFTVPVDTISAFVRKDGRVLSTSGDSLITLKEEITPNNYYIIIRHRNHLSVMSNNPVFLNSFTELYDFTASIDQYFGYHAHELSNGKFAMYPGDANCDGTVNILDYQIFHSQSFSALAGYLFADFNMDGILTGSDFNTFAPENKRKSTTDVPNSQPNKHLKSK